MSWDGGEGDLLTGEHGHGNKPYSGRFPMTQRIPLRALRQALLERREPWRLQRRRSVRPSWRPAPCVGRTSPPGCGAPSTWLPNRFATFCAGWIRVRRGNDSFRSRRLLSWRMSSKSSALRTIRPPMGPCCRMAGPGASGGCFGPPRIAGTPSPADFCYPSRTIAATGDSRRLHHWRAFAQWKGLLGDRPLAQDQEFRDLRSLRDPTAIGISSVIRWNDEPVTGGYEKEAPRARRSPPTISTKRTSNPVPTSAPPR
jgi:hypothetical protein